MNRTPIVEQLSSTVAVIVEQLSSTVAAIVDDDIGSDDGFFKSWLRSIGWPPGLVRQAVEDNCSTLFASSRCTRHQRGLLSWDCRRCTGEGS